MERWIWEQSIFHKFFEYHKFIVFSVLVCYTLIGKCIDFEITETTPYGTAEWP